MGLRVVCTIYCLLKFGAKFLDHRGGICPTLSSLSCLSYLRLYIVLLKYNILHIVLRGASLIINHHLPHPLLCPDPDPSSLDMFLSASNIRSNSARACSFSCCLSVPGLLLLLLLLLCVVHPPDGWRKGSMRPWEDSEVFCCRIRSHAPRWNVFGVLNWWVDWYSGAVGLASSNMSETESWLVDFVDSFVVGSL